MSSILLAKHQLLTQPSSCSCWHTHLIPNLPGAFYGNKLFQSKFIEALYPNVRSCAAEAGPGLSSKGRGSKGGSRVQMCEAKRRCRD